MATQLFLGIPLMLAFPHVMSDVSIGTYALRPFRDFRWAVAYGFRNALWASAA
jgi:hypothetical protein